MTYCMPLYIPRDEIDTSLFFGDMDIHPLTLLLLAHRGIQDIESAKAFLTPSYEEHIGDPFDIFGMKEAAARIIAAIKQGEKIALYTDYDCDGIPGGVLLRDFFAGIGIDVEVYIPHRHNEGYGLHNHALDLLKEKGVGLIITVDLAIANIDEVAYAKSIGIDCIVTDHHLPIHKEMKNGKIKQVVPDAIAVINSKQDACMYDDDMLCGCAVAWKLACAVLFKLRKEKKGKSKTLDAILEKVEGLPIGYEKWLLDLVAISTISDMVPLVKENRALAHFGLKVLQKTRRPGLRHVLYTQGVSQDHITEEDISFTIAPRINAASRMGIPMQAHQFLFEKNLHDAVKYAEALETLNAERKKEVKDVIDGIVFDHDVYKKDVIVVGDMSWGPGILGLIAQKIIDETGKPVFVWGQGEDKTCVKGSCRGAGKIHVVELMAHVGKEQEGGMFINFGGHEQAGGFSISVSKLALLEGALQEGMNHVTKLSEEGGSRFIDAMLSLEDVNEVTHKAVAVLSPFGAGNPKPLFSFASVQPLSVRWFGKKGEHLEAIYPKGESSVKAIIFFADKNLENRLKEKHTLVAHLEKSYFRGKGELRLRIVDVL